MTKTLRKISILLMSGLFLMNAACTTVKPVYNVGEDSFAKQVQVGDWIRVTYLDGRVRDIDVTAVSETGVSGTIHKNTAIEPKGYKVDSDWRDVHSVETVKISAIKTAGATVGVVAAIPLLAIGVIFMGAGG